MLRILRYREDLSFLTPRDTLSDIVDQLQFCTSSQYASDLLAERHSVTGRDASKRGARLAAHVTTALAFVDQALNSSPNVASVPAYYAVLNLAKCYILASGHHAALDRKMQHGISYRTYAKDSQHLLTEEIDLQPRGVLSTLYEVITGEPLISQRLRVRDFYPLIMDIGSEWSLASGTEEGLAPVSFDIRLKSDGRRIPYAKVDTAMNNLSVRSVPLLKGFARIPKSRGEFLGKVDTSREAVEEIIRKQTRCWLLYDAHLGYVQTPISGGRMLFPQEIPILLTFYHLSSVSRYNPELLAKIKSSRFWPLVVSARWHALQKFCILAWSYLQQRNVMVNPRPWIDR